MHFFHIDLNLSSTSLVVNDKILGSKIVSVAHEPPIQESGNNMSYIGKF